MPNSEFDEPFRQVLIENTAQTVFMELEQLYNARETYERRWIWELLQNASDAAEEDGVRVYVQVSDSELRFAHTGKPFTIENIGHLIYHGSTKQMDDEATGRFGTGFMATHLISKRVQVEGVLDDSRKFAFTLSRDGNNSGELRDNMDDSRRQFEESLDENVEPSEFGTVYTYPIDDDVIRSGVLEAIDDLKRFVPLVLAFNERLKEVRLEFSNCLDVIAKERPTEQGSGFQLYPVNSHDTHETETENYVVTSALNEEVNVGIPLIRTNAGFRIELTTQTPRLFLLFPLLGSESFAFPAVINSREFEPTPDRDGIWLWTSDEAKVIRNSELIELAIEKFLAMSQLASQHLWERPDRLARLGPIHETKWLKTEPYRQVISEKLLPRLRDCPLLINMNQEYIPPRKAMIPVSSENVTPIEIWKFAAKFRTWAATLPRQEDANYWAIIVAEWALILNIASVSMEEALTLEDVANVIDESGSIHDLLEHLVDATNIYEWLNELFELLVQADLKQLFDDLALLPDQKGEFHSRNLPLYRDLGIDDGLKQIAEELGCPGRGELLANEIQTEALKNILQEKTETELLSECVAELKRQAKVHGTNHDGFLANSMSLLAWIVRYEKWAELSEFPVLTRAGSAIPESVYKLYSDTAVTAELPLCPCYAWPEKARPFVELFPPRLVLTDEYVGKITADMWSLLATNGFVRTTPLYFTKERIKCFLPDESWSIDDEDQVESVEPVMISQLAFLRMSKQGVIDRIRGSKERAIQFVEFLITFVLDEDENAFEKNSVACDDDNSHEYFRAGWLIYLAQRSWVPAGKRSSKATAESLGNLLRGSVGVLEHLTMTKSRKLLSALRVGLADLSLYTLAEEEESRVSLMSAISDIARAADGDAKRVQRLAEEISSSPQLIDEIEKRAELRRIIQNNQAIGRIVEELLRDALQSESIKVTRTGVGSDYEVENDLIEEGQEQFIEVTGRHSFLIEVKSSRSDKVGMTVTQAKLAVKECDRFILCIVDIEGKDILLDEIRANARFVTDIGVRLEAAVSEYGKFEASQYTARGSVDDERIEVEISDSDVRFKIAKCLGLEVGLEFDAAVDFIRDPPDA